MARKREERSHSQKSGKNREWYNERQKELNEREEGCDKIESSVRAEERGKPYSNLNLETKSKPTNSSLK